MFLDQIPKKHWGFLEFYEIPKKTSSFPKFQNFQNYAYLSKYFWNFGILENSMFCGNFSCGRMAVYLIENILEAVCSNGFLTQHAVATLRMANRRK